MEPALFTFVALTQTVMLRDIDLQPEGVGSSAETLPFEQFYP
jgi:hypothetical protein